jgi:hypothetical protein
MFSKMSTTSVKNISLAAWNMNGIGGDLVNKTGDPDFIKEISSHDIICLSETHVGPEYPINIENYIMVPNTRKICKTNNRFYGGMALLFRKNLKNGIEILKDGDSESIWVKLKKNFFMRHKDLYIGFVYVAPNMSTLATFNPEDPYQRINEIFSKYQDLGDVIIMGDLNGRTGIKADYIEQDSDEHCPLPELYEIDQIRPRVNQDHVTNSQGLKLLDLCIANRLRILNGRTLGDITGRLTCYRPNGSSAVDYVLVPENFIDQIQYFKVHEYQAHLSDHCCISTRIHQQYTPPTQKNEDKNAKRIRHYQWSQQIESQFKLVMDSNEITQQINNFMEIDHTKCSIDDMVTSTNSIVYNIANKTASRTSKKKKSKPRTHKRWYDQDCRTLKLRVKHLGKLRSKFPNDPHIIGSLYKTQTEEKRLQKQTCTRVRTI